MFEKKSILVYDLEVDSLKTDVAKIKWFGAYSYAHDAYYLLPFIGNEKEIIALLKEHKVLVGFNNKQFDNEILKNNFNDENLLEYRVILDLYEMSAPKSGKDYGHYNKNRLAQMGIKLKSFTLKNIIEALKLDKDIGTKGDIDYKIFQRDEWLPSEIVEIKKYLQQDIDLTKALFCWYEEQFSPLKKFLPTKDQDNFLHLKSSLSVLAYNIICNKANLKAEFGEKTKTQSFSGGHHLESRWDLVKGNIIEIDFTSAYPHAIMMGNLCSPVDEREEPNVGWTGDNFYHIEGRYYDKEQGKIENALKFIFLERLKAKRERDDAKNKSYKIIINSFYGTTGNPVFKSIYNRKTASDCTSMVRTWMKKLAKTLEINGFTCLYGFTDSIFILVPPRLTKQHLMFIVEDFIKEALRHVSFPMKDTFKMEVEAEIKMIWFIAKNCYLFVTKDNKIEYKSTLLNTNTPKAVMKLFEEYMKPIIIENLNIPFTKKELELKMREILEKEPDLSAQEYKVGELGDYKVKTSLQYQISEKYGTGRHFLVPNRAGIGIGLAKHSKKGRAIRHCTIEEFKNNGLKISDIDLTHLLSHLKPFYERNEKHEQEKEIGIQQTLM